MRKVTDQVQPLSVPPRLRKAEGRKTEVLSKRRRSRSCTACVLQTKQPEHQPFGKTPVVWPAQTLSDTKAGPPGPRYFYPLCRERQRPILFRQERSLGP